MKKDQREQGVNLNSFSEKSRRQKKHNGRLIAVNIVTSFVLVLSVIALSGMLLLNTKLFRDPNDVVDPNPGTNTASMDFDNVSKSPDEDVTYFLVCGTDEGNYLTDIMMVICFDHGNHKLSILQIPRDTYIGSDVNTGKINAVYGSAKKNESRINTLIKRINNYLGLPIDHYILVSISAFRDIVDAVDGVDVYLPNRLRVADSDTSGNYHNVYYIGPGMTHLNGAKAEGFIRNRSGTGYAKGDMSRVEAQRNFYAAFAKKVMNMTTTQMIKVATSCYDEVKTDMAVGLLLGYATELKKLTLQDMTIAAIPGQSGTYKPPGLSVARSYYSIHKDDYVALINEKFNPYGEPIQASDLKITELHTHKEESNIEGEKTLDELVE